MKHFISTEKPGKQIHEFPPQGYVYNSISLFARLCCGPRPKLYLGKTPATTNLFPPNTDIYTMSTETLFSTGLQTPSQNCNMLARQGSPLQSHALSQQDLFMQGQETDSLVCICQDTLYSPFSTVRKQTHVHAQMHIFLLQTKKNQQQQKTNKQPTPKNNFLTTFSH